jgi:3'-phosphoadenosine 5'-phosphosulfate sulfotransferase (PAPS reductase)/FAD synthetase
MTTTKQLSLFDLVAEPSPKKALGLTDDQMLSYDFIVVSSSAGKDSQAMLDYVVERCRALDILDRVIVVHADLGIVEWQGTKELAEEQASFYGLPFVAVSRIGTISDGYKGKDTVKALYDKGAARGDLLDQVEKRAQQLAAVGSDATPWPGRTGRWCTSDFKRGPILKHFTKISNAWHKANPKAGRPVRILDCWGLRAEESPPRKQRIEKLEAQGKAVERRKESTSRKHIDTWLPIARWTEQEVWDRINASGTKHHYAYDLGMPRLSCAFCVFAQRDALMIAGEHNPALLQRYVDVERTVGSTFQPDLSLADLQAALAKGERAPAKASTWAA